MKAEKNDLLSLFNKEIQKNGGRLRLLAKVSLELKNTPKFKNDKVETSKESIIYNLWHNAPMPEIEAATGIGHTRIREIAKFLGLGRKGYIQNYDDHGQIVLNLETGIYYYSISAASESLGREHSYLGKKLLGKRKNNTSFIKV